LAIQQALDPVGNPANQTLVQLAIQEIHASPNWQSSNIIAWPSWQPNKTQAWICWIANWTRPWFAGLPTWHRFCWIGNWAQMLLDCETWPGLGSAGLSSRPGYYFAGLPIAPDLDVLDCQLNQTLVCWRANWAQALLDCQLGSIFCWARLGTPGDAWRRPVGNSAKPRPSWQSSKSRFGSVGNPANRGLAQPAIQQNHSLP